MKVLMIGDVVGSPGRRMFMREVPRLRRELGLAAVVVNAENCAAGSGLTAALAKGLFEAGADAITLGDHTWGQKEFPGEIGSLERVVRPANFASECPGRGWTTVTLPVGRFAVVNVQGRVFMQAVDCPFKAIDRVLAEIPKNVSVFVDFHAEATSEKITMGHYLDGRVTAVVGTHLGTGLKDQEGLVLDAQVGKRQFGAAVLVLRRWQQFRDIFLQMNLGRKIVEEHKQQRHQCSIDSPVPAEVVIYGNTEIGHIVAIRKNSKYSSYV
jgi:calcineurin-like phosphoesterase